ncbi:hypothetical protein Tco_0918611 [Tanacetum coccineum]
MVATTAMWHATSACRPSVSLRGSGTSADRVPLAYVAATSTADVAEDVVERFFKKRIVYDTYCKYLLNRRSPSPITSCDIFNNKGLIDTKIYG